MKPKESIKNYIILNCPSGVVNEEVKFSDCYLQNQCIWRKVKFVITSSGIERDVCFLIHHEEIDANSLQKQLYKKIQFIIEHLTPLQFVELFEYIDKFELEKDDGDEIETK